MSVFIVSFLRCDWQFVRGRAEQLAETRDRVGLELPDSLPGQAELGTDRLERLGLAVEAEAELEDPALALGQVGERLAHRAGTQGVFRDLLGIVGVLVREQVAELAVFVSDRRVERGARLGDRERLLDVLELQPGRLRELLHGRRPAELRLELPRVSAQGLPALVDVRRHADRPRLTGDGALNGLANPPGRVRRELEALAPVELLDRPVEADDAVLDQVAEGNAVTAVALRDVHDEAEVRVDHPLLRGEIAALDALCECHFLRRGQQRVATDLVQEEMQRIRGSGQRLRLERALFGRLELVFGAFEQGLDFRGLQGGADGDSFRSSGWTERLLSPRGRGVRTAARVLSIERPREAWHFRRRAARGTKTAVNETFATSSRLADNSGVLSAA